MKETEAHSCLKEESYNSTLLTLIDQRLSLTCFPWRSEHLALFPSTFSHLPTVFKRDGLIFPEIQFLFFLFFFSVQLMLLVCSLFILSLLWYYQSNLNICLYFKTRDVNMEKEPEEWCQGELKQYFTYIIYIVYYKYLLTVMTWQAGFNAFIFIHMLLCWISVKDNGTSSDPAKSLESSRKCSAVNTCGPESKRRYKSVSLCALRRPLCIIRYHVTDEHIKFATRLQKDGSLKRWLLLHTCVRAVPFVSNGWLVSASLYGPTGGCQRVLVCFWTTRADPLHLRADA